jgi:GrpB-like predicted nucleotidyltransferase (UPF0157 family)/GNAT superfamily N-acetyltransferase
MILSKLQVVPYDFLWPSLFEIEAQKAWAVLGNNCIDIQHVGSTSVMGLAAKPKIDMVASVKNLHKVSNLEQLGYVFRGCFNIPFRKSFMLRKPEVKVNFYIFEHDHPEMKLMIKFRDFLRQSESFRNEYQALKYELLNLESSHVKNNSMFVGYTLGKNYFIQKVLKEAKFLDHRFVFCTHYAEWEQAKFLRQKYFFSPQNIADPYVWTFEHPEHRHFIFYMGVDIIGYAQIELPNKLRIIVIDEPWRSKGFGTKFLSLLEKWLKSENKRVINVESSPKALGFYKKNGYQEDRIIDVDVAMSKEL